MATDFVIEKTDLMDEADAHRRHFMLWPKQWNEFDLDLSNYTWEEYKFIPEEQENIPTSQGVYSFVVKPSIANHPSCAYLMYVGQTSSQTLKKRFGQYLDEQAGKGKPRPKLLRVLNKYIDHLFFICLPLNGELTPREVETNLLKSLLPPCNTDLPVEVRYIMGAFE